jgi:hypothetical protein
MYLRAILCTFQISVDFYYVPVGGTGRRERGGLERGGWNLYRTGTVRILTVPVSTVEILTVPVQYKFHPPPSPAPLSPAPLSGPPPLMAWAWAQMALSMLVAISGPEKVSIFRPPPLKCPLLWICPPPQNHIVPHHTNNRYINS